jgi:sec-independent protein translocase protein TatC
MAVAVVCGIYGQQVIEFFCRPLVSVLLEQHINPQLYFTAAGDPFTVYLKITMVSAGVLASPWIVWQLWLFVAAGLYPKERKAIWRYAPLSIGLLTAGVLFCFLVVLPTALRFFIVFGGQMNIHLPENVAPPTTMPAVTVPTLAGDPAAPVPYQIWFDTLQQRLKLAVPDEHGVIQNMVVMVGPQALVSPLITLPDYIDMVLMWLMVFGLAFQLPLVSLAVARLGIVSVEDLSRFRRYVYVILAIVSAMLMPDVFSGTLALMVPLCLLYEFGILLARMGRK